MGLSDILEKELRFYNSPSIDGIAKLRLGM
jgi:hypothetical protein